MVRFRAFDIAQHQRKLALQRPLLPSLEREFLGVSGEFFYERQNWVEALIDSGHKVSFDAGTTTAYRSISLSTGDLFWLVRHVDKDHGYHSESHNPLHAVEEAQSAWRRRKDVRRQWHMVESIARDLLFGRRRFDVTVEDALTSPLCDMGIREFLRRNRLQRFRRISGRFAAMLMKFEPQVGFVINQASLRHAEESAFLPASSAV